MRTVFLCSDPCPFRKIAQLARNSQAAIARDWFTARGNGVDLGWFGKLENESIARRMRTIFADWIHNGHSDLKDVHTVILAIELTQGVLFSHGTKCEIDFSR